MNELITFPDFGFLDAFYEVVETGLFFVEDFREFVDGVASGGACFVDVEEGDSDYREDDFGLVVEEDAHAAVVEDVSHAEFLKLGEVRSRRNRGLRDLRGTNLGLLVSS